eukprot:TRINITY_DN1989_c0_g1_i5.p1 TRINITY_DN1989_c0_g1~~TRINITY_DN1989_c0_g1_i5.p1  ORF type:complete len:478 (+),score=131.50 TRINITY_DN1989_c0_g1_i5:857-2290(+)
MDVTIELFPLQKPSGEKFDFTKFYADLVTVDPDEINDASTKISQLSVRIKQKEFKKRVLGRCDFHLSPELKMGIRFYTMIHHTKKPYPVKLDAKSNKLLKSTTKPVCKETGSILYPNQIGTFFPLGGEKIRFNKEEMQHIKKFDTPSLKLMGFKPRSRLKDYHNIRTSYFLYPDEDRFIGSGQLAHGLITEMLRKDQIAIVRFVPRSTSNVRFCALLPQQEFYDEDNFQTPPGFNLVWLPYADDLRKPDTVRPVSRTEVSREEIQVAKILINSLSTQEFDCRSFDNHSVQKFFANLTAIALREDLKDDELVDSLEPDREGLEKNMATLLKFRDVFWGDHYFDPDAVSSTKSKSKRPANPDGGTKRGKANIGEDVRALPRGRRGRDEEEDAGPNEYDFDDGFLVDDRKKGSKKGKKGSEMEVEDVPAGDFGPIIKHLRQGELKKVTVNDLKEFLSAHGQPVKGKKDELVDRALRLLSS